MERLGELKPVIETLFRQRLEDVVAGELVTEIGGKQKSSKPKLAILCQPMNGKGGGGTLNIVILGEGKGSKKIKIKQTYAIERLGDITHDGSFDATFNFAASGMLSVSFGSYIQREMFIASVRKILNSVQKSGGRGGAFGPGPIHSVLTDAVGAAAEMDAALRVRKLRQEKRRVFNHEEEEHLLKAMDSNGFDDIKQFQDILLRVQKEAELTSVDSLIESAEAWEEVKNQVQDLVLEVEELEGRIENYTTNLLEKKSVIQKIEHENSTLQQQQLNLENLYVMLADLRDQLSLKPEAVRLLARLRTEPEESLIAFFSESQNASVLSEAMNQMHTVLHNKALEKDFPIAAVKERKAFFLEQRRMIALRSQNYIFSLIETSEGKYLADKTRFSRGNTLVWRLHTELTTKLFSIRGILKSLMFIDFERFVQTQRKYRTSMQKVYSLEIAKFLKCIRKQVKKISKFRGPFLLGTSQTSSEALRDHVESAQAGQTPRNYRGTPSISPALTPRMFQFDDVESREEVGSQSSAGSGSGQLSIEFPPCSLFPEVELFDNPNTLRRLDARGAGSSVATGLKSLVRADSGGYLRPDLAFGIALESVLVAILQEERVLSECFGVHEKEENDEGANAFAEGAAERGEENPKEPFDAAILFYESVVELFGGNKMHLEDVQDRASSSMGYASNDLSPFGNIAGLPPRYPVKKDSVLSGTDPLSKDRDELDVFDSQFNQNVSKDTLKQIENCFLIREFVDFTHYMMDRCDRIYSIPILCMIKNYINRAECPTSKSTFCLFLLKKMESIVSRAMMQFVAEQTESIIRCRKKYIIKPTSLLHCFTKMPAFFGRLETVHNVLSMKVVDRTSYTSIATSLVDQSFDVLDFITNIKTSGGGTDGETKLKISEVFRQKMNVAFEGAEADMQSIKRGFIQQYRTHAFFCAFYVSLPQGCHAWELLREHYESSKAKRDRYEELYLTRILLVQQFPFFGTFALSAEDLSSTYSREELRHHRALAPEVVQKVLNKLEKEVRGGVKEAASRMKKHFLRDVDPDCNEESFHRTLLQRTWQHFSTLLLQKIEFLEKLTKWNMYQDLRMPITCAEVKELLSQY